MSLHVVPPPGAVSKLGLGTASCGRWVYFRRWVLFSANTVLEYLTDCRIKLVTTYRHVVTRMN